MTTVTGDGAADHAAAERPRAPRRFTVMLPVVRPPAMLPYAIRSVLAQTEPSFELCVICDGAPAETVEAARAFARQDPRVAVFAFPKGERHGEAHRAAVLRGARTDFVAQIGDDDLWFGDHLARLAQLLERADFVSLPQITIREEGFASPSGGDLVDAETRARMRDQVYNFFGPSECGYRLAAYKALPIGWSPAPPDLPTDLFMWRKFLAQDGLRFRTGFVVTSLKLSAQHWKEQPLERRAAVLADFATRLEDPAECRKLRRRGAAVLARKIAGRRLLRACLRGAPGAPRVLALRLLHAITRRGMRS